MARSSDCLELSAAARTRRDIFTSTTNTRSALGSEMRLKEYLQGRGIPERDLLSACAASATRVCGIGICRGAFPEAEKCSGEVLSLPIYPELKDEQLQAVAQAIENSRRQRMKSEREHCCFEELLGQGCISASPQAAQKLAGNTILVTGRRGFDWFGTCGEGFTNWMRRQSLYLITRKIGSIDSIVSFSRLRNVAKSNLSSDDINSRTEN